MKQIEKVYQTLIAMEEKFNRGIAAQEISNSLNMNRPNISRYLNTLYRENLIEKIDGRPVLYCKKVQIDNEDKLVKGRMKFDKMIGSNMSLQIPIQQAKAAILYPPCGLHTLLLGETGVGKSMFAESMYRFALESKAISKDAPFIQFNCADYAENPQLLSAQIFGVKKGAYTGAEQNREGLLKKADCGILFLDEVHRLSPQGQEMLFTYIDKGWFRPLGETDKLVKVKVRIIAATTEMPQSYLLKTFMRRIPMTITLPSLNNRNRKERYQLIETFIKEESHRLDKNIYVNKSALMSFLLYDCPNNIGQLKSDIQLACAKAFLTYKTHDRDYIMITQSDLPQYVKQGLLSLHDFRKEINDILNDKEDILKFYYKEDGKYDDLILVDENDGFYDLIEKKLNNLKEIGIEENEINQILNIDIETRFEKYIGNLPRKFKKEELSKLVNIDIIEAVEEIFDIAEKRLNRKYDEKVYFGLALHLQGSIERIKRGSKIYNPKLNFIRVNYDKEFLVAMEIAKLIDISFKIETPLDEIGYLAMFLTSNSNKFDEKEETKVVIMVIMHGDTTASSMANVANSLVGTKHVRGIDMPLHIKPTAMYGIVKKEILELDCGRGTLLLVDMGSLTNFGDMLCEELRINIKTIDMVSTPIVIEACRKSILDRDLEEIYQSCIKMKIYSKEDKQIFNEEKKSIIITACFTGEGAAIKLKSIIKQQIELDSDIDIVPLNILNKNEFWSRIKYYQEKNHIIAIIGAVDIKAKYIPFISVQDIFSDNGMHRLENIIEQHKKYKQIGKSLKEHLVKIDGEEIVKDVIQLINMLEEAVYVELIDDVKIGLVLHISFLVDNLLQGRDGTKFEQLDSYINKYSKEFKSTKLSLKSFETKYDIQFNEDEIAYICRMLLENNILKNHKEEDI